MTTFLAEIAANAARGLLNPVVLVIAVVAAAALVTGLAGRVAILVEDRLHASATRIGDRTAVVPSITNHEHPLHR